MRSGDTLARISVKTGVPVALLEAYNPTANAFALVPGQRLNLWAHPPQRHRPKPKAPGPTFWTVKPGQSFGSIASATHIDIATLEQLNPGLSPASVQAGDRVRLHR